MNKYQKLLDLGMREVTSNAQRNHGTRAFAIDTNEGTLVYATYATGYVRSVNRAYSCYQLNPIVKRKTKTQVVDADTGEVLYTRAWGNSDIHCRKLLMKEEDRIDLLYNYIKKNFIKGFIPKQTLKSLNRGNRYR